MCYLAAAALAAPVGRKDEANPLATGIRNATGEPWVRAKVISCPR